MPNSQRENENRTTPTRKEQMRNLLMCAGIFAYFISFLSIAAGPTGVGNIKIGMSKEEYLSEIGITSLTDCKTLKDKNGKPVHFELRNISAYFVYLMSPCLNYILFDGTKLKDRRKIYFSGIDDTIQINGIIYNYIFTDKKTSKIIETLGDEISAIFLKNKLIGIEIGTPKVTFDTLIKKYGQPTINDETQTKICQNRIGNKFENKAGSLDAVWANGEVRTIFRYTLSDPVETCTDNRSFTTYTIEENKQMDLIRSAINDYIKEAEKSEIKSSPF